jgi:hypothetical protein
MIFDHLLLFSDQASPLGLGLFSEQTPEGAHHNFELKWKDYVVLDHQSEQYGPRLLGAVTSYAGHHV